jgi:hypothetical protein
MVVNGKVFTGQSNGFAEAFAVREGKVIEVGTTNEIKSKYEKEYQPQQIVRHTIITLELAPLHLSAPCTAFRLTPI